MVLRHNRIIVFFWRISNDRSSLFPQFFFFFFCKNVTATVGSQTSQYLRGISTFMFFTDLKKPCTKMSFAKPLYLGESGCKLKLGQILCRLDENGRSVVRKRDSV